jgi:bifunctional non-homologous end joining protein LigD
MTASSRPAFVEPMLLRRVPALPEGAEWDYEVKWDGYRMQAIKCGDRVHLLSRNGAEFTRRFPEITRAVARLKQRTVHLDGELVAIDEQGRPSFQVLQGRSPLPTGWRIFAQAALTSASVWQVQFLSEA